MPGPDRYRTRKSIYPIITCWAKELIEIIRLIVLDPWQLPTRTVCSLGLHSSTEACKNPPEPYEEVIRRLGFHHEPAPLTFFPASVLHRVEMNACRYLI
jgi:hypothetical protein